LLLPQPHKKSKQVDLPPRLETPEECQRSEARSRARWHEIQLQREEVAADRDRFELARDKIVFSFELALAVIMVLAAVIVIALSPELAPFVLLGGGGIGGVATVLKRRSAAP
jgi:uncharacterized membrane protein